VNCSPRAFKYLLPMYGLCATGFDWRGVGEFAVCCAFSANNQRTPKYWNKTALTRIYPEDRKAAANWLEFL